jgi:hypothetical protein
MKLLLAALFAFSTIQAADSFDAMQGTWQFDDRNSDWSHKPGGAPQSASLVLTANGWTYKSVDATGKTTEVLFDKKTGTAASGSYKLIIKYEPTGNPDVSYAHVIAQDTGAEIERLVTVIEPGGDALLIYGSGVTPDGKQWWDSSTFKRAR